MQLLRHCTPVAAHDGGQKGGERAQSKNSLSLHCREQLIGSLWLGETALVGLKTLIFSLRWYEMDLIGLRHTGSKTKA
jgi:hypothetical protein